MRSAALISTYSKAGCYAVLASLSERYPPLEGRSPTRYSPVCHSTYPLRDFRVRLACVRHAASVDSEPGSNSHVKFAGRKHRVRRPGLHDATCLTRGPINWLLRCSIRIWSDGRHWSAFARTDNSGRTCYLRRHHADSLFVFSYRQLIKCCRVAAAASMSTSNQ